MLEFTMASVKSRPSTEGHITHLPTFKADDTEYSYNGIGVIGLVPNPSIAIGLEILVVKNEPGIIGWAGGTLPETIALVDFAGCSFSSAMVDSVLQACIDSDSEVADRVVWLHGAGMGEADDDLIEEAELLGWEVHANGHD